MEYYIIVFLLICVIGYSNVVFVLACVVGFLSVFLPSLVDFLLFRKRMLDKRKRDYIEWKKKSDAEMEEIEKMLDKIRNGII